MNIKHIFFFILIQSCTLVWAQTFNYDDSTRRVLVSGATNSDSLITINEEEDFWRFKDEIFIEGAYNGALQISNLGEDSICSKSYAWDYISGAFPNVPDSQTSLITSFSLSSETTLKIDFSGMGHFTNNNDYLFFEPVFFLKSGFTGSGGTLLQFNGSGKDYINLSPGDYRISSAIGTTYNCRNDPNCNLSFAYQSSLSVTSVDLNSVIGENFSRPFTPDMYLESENPGIDDVNSDGASVIRGPDSTYQYVDKPNGWYDMGSENHAEIDMISSGLITELQMPNNRQGMFEVSVEGLQLGEFTANDRIILADYSDLLASFLLTGINNMQGVRSIDIKYHPVSSDNIKNSCGQTNSTAIKFLFDESSVTFDALLPFTFVPDVLFFSGFDL